ncbi:hypothetical protein [Amycolatopsis plumensis]|uniref:hypothetical protein n=1 Tax=Amycolatopsis plumensis TaxID=236508 RepID=UPI00361B54E2
MTPSILGCAELYGRLRYVTNHTGAQRRTHPPAGTSTASTFDDHDPLGLHGHVLQGLGATPEYLDDFTGASAGYPAVRIPAHQEGSSPGAALGGVRSVLDVG